MDVAFEGKGISIDAGNSENKKEPVVLLFGWAYSYHRHVRKIATQLWNEKGYDTVTVSDREFTSFRDWFNPRAVEENADRRASEVTKAVEKVIDSRKDEFPLICHAFSNGGLIAYTHFMK